MTALGVTRCVGCERTFASTPELEVVERDGNAPTPARPGYRAGRAGGTVTVSRRWHRACLEAEIAAETKIRDDADRRRDELIAELRAAVEAGQ